MFVIGSISLALFRGRNLILFYVLVFSCTWHIELSSPLIESSWVLGVYPNWRIYYLFVYSSPGCHVFQIYLFQGPLDLILWVSRLSLMYLWSQYSTSSLQWLAPISTSPPVPTSESQYKLRLYNSKGIVLQELDRFGLNEQVPKVWVS